MEATESRTLIEDEEINDETVWKGHFKNISDELLKDKLIQATKYKDKVMLEKSIKDYLESGQSTENNPELDKAGKQLDIIRTKDALVEATARRDVNDIVLLLKSIEENESESKKKRRKGKPWTPEDGYLHYVLYEVTEAKKVLRCIESGNVKNRKLVPPPLKMDKNVMSEIKRYSKPPGGLHSTMQACFLLLGVDEEITEDWTQCKKMANPDGREGLNRKIQSIDISSIEPEICARAKAILEAIEYKTIQRASAGAATFYTWGKGTIAEYEQTHNLDGVEAATVERQKELLRTSIPKEEYPMFTPQINMYRKKRSYRTRGKSLDKSTERQSPPPDFRY